MDYEREEEDNNEENAGRGVGLVSISWHETLLVRDAPKTSIMMAELARQ